MQWLLLYDATFISLVSNINIEDATRLGGEKDRMVPAAILPHESTCWTWFLIILFINIFTLWYVLGAQDPEHFLEPKKSNLKDKTVADGFWQRPSSALISRCILLKLSDATPENRCCGQKQVLALNL